jgi:hypothetical protein
VGCGTAASLLLLRLCSHFSADTIPVLDVNFASIGSSAGVTREAANTAYKIVLTNLGKALLERRPVSLEFAGVGRLSVSGSRAGFSFGRGLGEASYGASASTATGASLSSSKAFGNSKSLGLHTAPASLALQSADHGISIIRPVVTLPYPDFSTSFASSGATGIGAGAGSSTFKSSNVQTKSLSSSAHQPFSGLTITSTTMTSSSSSTGAAAPSTAFLSYGGGGATSSLAATAGSSFGAPSGSTSVLGFSALGGAAAAAAAPSYATVASGRASASLGRPSSPVPRNSAGLTSTPGRASADFGPEATSLAIRDIEASKPRAERQREYFTDLEKQIVFSKTMAQARKEREREFEHQQLAQLEEELDKMELEYQSMTAEKRRHYREALKRQQELRDRIRKESGIPEKAPMVAVFAHPSDYQEKIDHQRRQEAKQFATQQLDACRQRKAVETSEHTAELAEEADRVQRIKARLAEEKFLDRQRHFDERRELEHTWLAQKQLKEVLEEEEKHRIGEGAPMNTIPLDIASHYRMTDKQFRQLQSFRRAVHAGLYFK